MLFGAISLTIRSAGGAACAASRLRVLRAVVLRPEMLPEELEVSMAAAWDTFAGDVHGRGSCISEGKGGGSHHEM